MKMKLITKLLVASLLILYATTMRAQQSCPVQVTFSSVPSTVNPGDAVTLTWTTTGARTVNITPGNEDVQKSGTMSVRPTRTSSWSLIAIAGPIGLSCSKSAVVVVKVTSATATKSVIPKPQVKRSVK